MSTVPIVTLARHDAVKIRAHTVLCLQGFRGEGYSIAFVDNMAAIARRLCEDSHQLVEIIDGPDAVCGACPHLRRDGCTLHGEDTEPAMRAQDHEVLARLGLHVGDRLPWADILNRIRRSLTGESLTDICGECRWLPLGYCRTGIDRLRGESSVQESSAVLKEQGPCDEPN